LHYGLDGYIHFLIYYNVGHNYIVWRD